MTCARPADVSLTSARMRRRPRRASLTLVLAGLLALAVAGCGGTKLLSRTDRSTVTVGIPSQTPQAVAKLGIPSLATKNTTRVDGADPAADAAGVALAVFPSAAPGTHPSTVTIAPTDDWQAALAASVLMAPPIHAPVLLSGGSSAARGDRAGAVDARADWLRTGGRCAGDPGRLGAEHRQPALGVDQGHRPVTRWRRASTASSALSRGGPARTW